MIAMENKQLLRHEIIEACMARQQFRMDDLNDRLSTLKIRNTSTTDHTTSIRIHDEMTFLESELHRAGYTMELLENLKVTETAPRDKVMMGAIIDTNHGRFFVSAKLKKFTVHGDNFIGVSVHSPFYSAMKNKHKGEAFQFNGVTYKINEIL